jgi:hypothetical protein
MQTSRLRLAMSSVQTFIQRCFLNLENGATAHPELNVAPSALDPDSWSWMKRYRVWQANREIFLYPENWMQPELRLDKTDLFQTLESALLQGDVTNDLVEDAFLEYLKGLDLRARLDIVATYLDQNVNNPADETLHVLGRTYSHPHKYFYRTYSNGAWTGWQAVPLDIESDHIVLAVWRSRLNLVWLTFVTRTQALSSGTSDTTALASLQFNSFESTVLSGKPQKQVQVQLHWSEFVQGKWTNRISTDVGKSQPINVLDSFDPTQVHPHVTKEIDANGNEGALLVHVDFPAPGQLYWVYNLLAAEYSAVGNIWGYLWSSGAAATWEPFANVAFRITSKNCNPDLRPQYWQPAPLSPYNVSGVDATFYTGSSNLNVNFDSYIQSNGTGTPESEQILNSVQNFELLPCSNPVAPPFTPANDPLLPNNFLEYWEAGNLVSPFFFRDTSNPSAAGGQPAFLDERTFFVQPSLTETVITEWEGWAVTPFVPSQIWTDSALLNSITVIPQVPVSNIPLNPGDPVYSIFPMQKLTDWVTNPAVTVSYGGIAVAKTGGIQSSAQAAVTAAGRLSNTALSALARTTSPSGLALGKQGLSINQMQAIRKPLPAPALKPPAKS